MRPGNGYGDDNHEHSGPPGHESDPQQPAAPNVDPPPSDAGADTGDDQHEHGHEADGDHGHGDDGNAGHDNGKQGKHG